MSREQPQPARWDEWVSLVLHPIKVAILEAILWIDKPLSAKLLDECFDRMYGVSLIAYHLRTLADSGIIEPASQNMVRGAVQTFYRLGRPGGPC